MDVYEAMRTRRAIRNYNPKPIEEDKLNRVLEALRLAPSGNNKQPVRFIVIKDASMKEKLVKQACNQGFIKEAPVIVVACCEKGREFDAAIAMDHLTLAAAGEDLGTCWIRWFDRPSAALILGVPDSHEVAVIMPMGYPDETPDPRPRLPLSDLIRQDRY